MGVHETKVHFFDGFLEWQEVVASVHVSRAHIRNVFLKWQEVVASVHVSRETGPTFLTFFWSGRSWWRPFMSPENRSHICNVFL